ncbi:class I SAM-dependent methyltransferase [Nostoc sp. 'Lobaria pulmonaria (5183) cyanobiont']|uniref:class I SAM-dependent methyltransferase n=1 Tax=Nostoc sp. 'Lobaria pulmonaria (5183) cyanobiont' TaxID=1618022 RepID=UPI000CF34BEE|nr:class I SAM-dependent methyltransferase [Nostoc sp. 'Lobaria pulmonaria (5183) cyanobiont']AVH71159.1 methyltransferase [Nostoc sp. 'Lobaria pulmonaria (5183) cyanobiont']
MDKSEYVSNFDSLILSPQIRKLYGQKEFFNVGYWLEDTQNQQSACFNLLEKLLDFILEKKGNILDVGCGLGATTSHLLNYYSSTDIVGINISSQQIERSIVNAPECKFICMDAVQMEFEDESFDNIICVEAAFYFDTREKFLKEAWRVLKPGGHLILSDIIFENTQHFGDWIVPQKNIVKDQDIEEYKNIYKQVGFQLLDFVDVTEKCWLTHYRYLKSSIEEEFQAGEIDEQTYQLNIDGIDGLLNSSSIAYLLVSTKKPAKVI